MKKYKRLYRTTFDKVGDGIPYSGIYVIAYLGKVLYVGQASENVFARIKTHVYYNPDSIGMYLSNMQFDWKNIVLDILEPPDDYPGNWLKEAEAALIRRFQPVFNTQLQM